MDNKEIIEAVREWQQTESIHPLTCANDSTHALLEPREGEKGVVLFCPDCEQVQEVPEMVITAWKDGSLDSHRKAVAKMQKVAKCQHEYEGNHADGWKCRLCDDEQEVVLYSDTVDSRQKFDALERGREALKQSIHQMANQGVCQGLTLALAALQSGTYKTIDDAVVGITHILGEIMLRKEKPSDGGN